MLMLELWQCRGGGSLEGGGAPGVHSHRPVGHLAGGHAGGGAGAAHQRRCCRVADHPAA